jgi:hypothetical protein
MTVDELGEHGVVRMDDDHVREYLSSQSVGVLALPGDEAPHMRPMSYGYDGESRLYFTYVVGTESRKTELSDRAEAARFLVYSAETPFNWRSVLLTGELGEVPDDERESVLATTEIPWRPDLFERAGETEETRLYEFRIRERVGIKHVGLPPGFEDERPDPGPE